MKLNETHLECIRKYLEEDRSIGPAKALNQLKNDTGIEVCYRTFYPVFKKLKKEIYQDSDNLVSSKIRSSHSEYGVKLLDIHIECLKKYLRENMSIGNTEATNRLCKETGLKISVYPVRKALLKLEQEINQENLDLESSDSAPKIDTKPWVYGLKVKPLHIEYLKKYLSENSSIGYTEVTNRLHKDTGLDVSVFTIRKVIVKLKKEASQDNIELKIPTSTAKVRRRPGNFGSKLKDLHIKCLKNYLNENIFIGPTEAKNRLYDETGLQVSTPTISKILSEFKERAPMTSPIVKRNIGNNLRDYGHKLKDSDIERLIHYLDENCSIKLIEAKNRLYRETGLQVCISDIHKIFSEYGEKVKFDQDSSHASTSDSENKSKSVNYKLKDLYIERLKSYLNEDNYISGTQAMDRLYKETGLELSATTVYKALNNLKNQLIFQKKSPLSPKSNIEPKSLSWKFGKKLKEVHIECLKKYLNEENSIGATKAKNKLCVETGLEISIFPIENALKILRKEIEQEKNNLTPSTS